MLRLLYKRLLKPILFLFDPEWVHDVFVSLGAFMGKGPARRAIIGAMYGYKGSDAMVTVDGITYRSPVMLAAGFDYNGRLATILDRLAFGGDEIGSVTARACEGNEKPRLRRMVRSKALIVYKGLRNEGVETIMKRLKAMRKPEGFVWGISIAKTNDAESASPEAGIEDYATSYRRLMQEGVGDFYTINISCPNVHGGENFAEPTRLNGLMAQLARERERANAAGYPAAKRPLYAKMPINLDWAEFNELLKVLDSYGVNGVVIGNLNKVYTDAEFQDEAPSTYRGGLSGKPCSTLSTELIGRTRSSWGKRFTIIGCGGVMNAEDAIEKFEAGADLLQLISGMIFEGPHLMSDICKAYAEHKTRALSHIDTVRSGEKTVSEAEKG